MKQRLLIVLVFLLCGLVRVQAQNKPIQFTAKKEKPVTSATQTVTVRVSDFADVTTVQFTLQWPAATFQFVSVDKGFDLPDLSAASFNEAMATSTGKLTFSWYNLAGIGTTLPDGSIAFKINFTVKGPVPNGSLLEIAAGPTPTEATRLLKPASVLFTNENLSGCDCK